MNKYHHYRLVATDLDGTLLRRDETISPRTRLLLERVRSLGIRIVLVTARPPRALRLLARSIGVEDLAICLNGAVVYDLATDAIVTHTLIAAATAQSLVNTLRLAAPGVSFAIERGMEYGYEAQYANFDPHREPVPPLIGDALLLCTQGINKLIVHHTQLEHEDLFRIVSGVVGTMATVTYSGAPFVEIAASGITKAVALEGLCARYAIRASEVIAFGDMPNDLPMLRWAGHGVAVANGHEAVRAVADEVTVSNDEDGVADVLERIFLGA